MAAQLEKALEELEKEADRQDKLKLQQQQQQQQQQIENNDNKPAVIAVEPVCYFIFIY